MKNALWIFATVAAMGLATTAAAANSSKSHHKPAAQKKAHVNHGKSGKHLGQAKHATKSAPSAVAHMSAAAHKPQAHKPAVKHTSHAKKPAAGSRLERRHA